MLLVSWDCRISAYTSSRRKKETDRLPRLSSGWHEHIQALTRSRQLLSERVTTRVPLAQISGPFQELGRAALGRTGDARRDEQRGVAIVLSPGVVEDPFSSLLRRDAQRGDGGVLVRLGQHDAGPRTLDQRDYRWRRHRRLLSNASATLRLARRATTARPPEARG